MFVGELVSIAIADRAAGLMRELADVEAVAGQGLVGDRYAELKGAFQRGRIEPMHQVTLVELEAIEAARQDYELLVTHLSTRRNLLTSGVPLNHLVRHEFWVGDVKLRGVKLCEPCRYLEKLAGDGWEQALRHRGGLRAEIVLSGRIRVGDSIRTPDAKTTVVGSPQT